METNENKVPQGTLQLTNDGTPKRSLGITKETTSGSGIPINAPKKLDKATQMYPNGYDFPLARLVNVVFEPAKEVKRNEETTLTPVLTFVLTTKEGKKFTHVEFPIEDDDEKFDLKLQQMQQRIKHFFVETLGESKFEEGSMDGSTFKEFFDNVAKAFNKHTVTVPSAKEGEADKQVTLYSRVQVYFKVTYYKDRLQLPLYPNFIQKAFAGTPSTQIPCELLINPTYDKLEATAKAKEGNSTYGAQGTGRDNTFAGADEDYPELP